MEEVILEILEALQSNSEPIDTAWLERILRQHNQGVHNTNQLITKKRLLPYYLDVRNNDIERWQSWHITPELEDGLIRLLRKKPRRTASGVATITVITKPWPCSSDCTYCPNDIRMPKSYLANEPACQRAEHNYFDPYLQVKSRLYVLEQMGHITDKIELIVLGGTWNDYPPSYQRWFVSELFRAVNDDEPYLGGPELTDIPPTAADLSYTTPSGAQRFSPQVSRVSLRVAQYSNAGLLRDPDELQADSEQTQKLINTHELSYNQAISQILASKSWQTVANFQEASWEELEEQHRINEHAKRRVVGLVIETRPDLITSESAYTMRRLGCTKIQMGIQSLDDAILQANNRKVSSAQIAAAFSILRAYGFKIHIHMMTNLIGATPHSDRIDYLTLVNDPRFMPDEIKLYPCALIESSHLMLAWENGLWQPYAESALIDLLVDDVLATPAYVRISRMIRDFSSHDIVAGTKRTNLRQVVEERLSTCKDQVQEIRMREVATSDVLPDDLEMNCVSYTTACTCELFLQWVTPTNRIAGFCRLSLPDREKTQQLFGDNVAIPVPPNSAMIREVHVYGRVASLGANEHGAAQHAGLGKALVEEACKRAQQAGYTSIAVISAIGTRGYYRSLGFTDAALYQIRTLTESL